MTPQDLEQIERAFDKAKMGHGPQALSDWALQHAPVLFAHCRAVEAADRLVGGDMQTLRALYPGLADGVSVVATAVDDIKAMREDRAKRAGYGKSHADAVHYSDHVTYGGALLAALRPFAAFGQDPVMQELDAIRENTAAPEDASVFAVVDAAGDVLAAITREHITTARALVQEADDARADSKESEDGDQARR